MTTTTKFSIDPKTTVGQVTVGVADLDMMTAYYQNLIGLDVIERDGKTAVLGKDNAPIVNLEARPNGKQYKEATGLYHLAILVPTRPDLGQWLRHYVQKTGQMIDGAGDHFVSEALYLSDPEGNGLEIYWDRPRDQWDYEPNGQVRMGTAAVDLPSLVEGANPAPFSGMVSGTTLGHVHLQVHNISQATAFYANLIGLDFMVGMPTATFLSAGGYHHHIGGNVWHSNNASPPPAGSLGLINYSFVLPSDESRTAVLNHLDNQNIAVEKFGDDFIVQDPSGNHLILDISS